MVIEPDVPPAGVRVEEPTVDRSPVIVEVGSTRSRRDHRSGRVKFDPEAVKRHLAQSTKENKTSKAQPLDEPESLAFGCPGSAVRVLKTKPVVASVSQVSGKKAMPSSLGNWPVQINLVPVQAPYFKKAKLLIAADCAPFAYAAFHQKLLSGRVLLIGCPKLDDADFYRQKLAQIFIHNDIESVDVVYMEVPCCFGLVQLVGQAIKESGKNIPLTLTKISISGDNLSEELSRNILKTEVI